jgi:hypothetical protein
MTVAELEAEAEELVGMLEVVQRRTAAVAAELRMRREVARLLEAPVKPFPLEVTTIRLPHDLESWGAANEVRGAIVKAGSPVDASKALPTGKAPGRSLDASTRVPGRKPKRRVKR